MPGLKIRPEEKLHTNFLNRAVQIGKCRRDFVAGSIPVARTAGELPRYTLFRLPLVPILRPRHETPSPRRAQAASRLAPRTDPVSSRRAFRLLPFGPKRAPQRFQSRSGRVRKGVRGPLAGCPFCQPLERPRRGECRAATLCGIFSFRTPPMEQFRNRSGTATIGKTSRHAPARRIIDQTANHHRQLRTPRRSAPSRPRRLRGRNPLIESLRFGIPASSCADARPYPVTALLNGDGRTDCGSGKP